MTDETHTPQEAGHEPTQVNVKAVAFWTGVLLLLLTSGMVLGGALLGLFDSGRQGAPGPFPVTGSKVTSAMPPLDVEQRDVRKRLEAEEERELTTYGWVDPEQKIVRIPIEQAMERLLARPFGGSQEADSAEGEEGPKSSPETPQSDETDSQSSSGREDGGDSPSPDDERRSEP